MAAAFTIRRAGPGDRDTLLGIWHRSVRATHGFLTDIDIESLRPEVRDVALVVLDVWVLVDGERPVGFAGLYGPKLEALFVDPAYFRRGGGRRLVDHARSLHGRLSVDVNEQNPAALRFYESLGFHRTGQSAVDGAGRPFPLVHLSEMPRDP